MKREFSVKQGWSIALAAAGVDTRCLLSLCILTTDPPMCALVFRINASVEKRKAFSIYEVWWPSFLFVLIFCRGGRELITVGEIQRKAGERQT